MRARPTICALLPIVLAVGALDCDRGTAHAPSSDETPEPLEETPADATLSLEEPVSLENMVRVPAGPFWFGCDEDVDSECLEWDEPGHRVYLNEYYIDRTEVTVEAYAECVAAGGCTEPRSDADLDPDLGGRLRCNTEERNWGQPGREHHPVNCVDWEQAYRYCVFRGKRLPTREEWEKAARGTDGRVYPWGNEPPSPQLAVMLDPGGVDCGLTQEVGSHPLGASPYGALDMAGNVDEWTLRSADDPRWPLNLRLPTYHRVLGGNYCSDSLQLQASFQLAWPHYFAGTFVGFRCVYMPTGAEEARTRSNLGPDHD